MANVLFLNERYKLENILVYFTVPYDTLTERDLSLLRLSHPASADLLGGLYQLLSTSRMNQFSLKNSLLSNGAEIIKGNLTKITLILLIRDSSTLNYTSRVSLPLISSFQNSNGNLRIHFHMKTSRN